jgi:hypothetical protein
MTLGRPYLALPIVKSFLRGPNCHVNICSISFLQNADDGEECAGVCQRWSSY